MTISEMGTKEKLERAVRVYAVVNLRTGRVHGMTCNVNTSRRWVREILAEYGPGSATQCVDLVDPEEQDVELDREDVA